MADPFSLASIASAGTLFSLTNATFKFTEFCLALKDVTGEGRVFLSLLSRVREDLHEAQSCRHQCASALSTNPSRKRYIDKAIADTEQALAEIGKYIEGVRVDGERGRSVTLKHRFEWVLEDGKRFRTAELRLATCHRALIACIGGMHGLYDLSVAGGAGDVSPPAPPYVEKGGLLSPVAADVMEEPLRRPSSRRPKKKTPLISLQEVDASPKMPSAGGSPLSMYDTAFRDPFNASQATLVSTGPNESWTEAGHQAQYPPLEGMTTSPDSLHLSSPYEDRNDDLMSFVNKAQIWNDGGQRASYPDIKLQDHTDEQLKLGKTTSANQRLKRIRSARFSSTSSV